MRNVVAVDDVNQQFNVSDKFYVVTLLFSQNPTMASCLDVRACYAALAVKLLFLDAPYPGFSYFKFTSGANEIMTCFSLLAL